MNIDKIRNDTPACKDKLFFNNAGASLMPQSVVQAVEKYLHDETQHGGYKVADLHEQTLDAFYTEAAKLINCQPDNIARAHDATDAYTKALTAVRFKRGDVLITTEDDYTSNHITFISLQKHIGIRIERIRKLDDSSLDMDHLEELIARQRPALIAVTHVPNYCGLIQNVEAVGDICHQREIPYLVDACQSVGQLDVDVQRIKCDFLSATGRKWLRGPRGTGFLYVSDRALQMGYAPLYLDGRGATWTSENSFETQPGAKRFETWEAPFAMVVGLTEALRYANALGMDAIFQRNQSLLTHLKQGLGTIPSIEIQDYGTNTCNLLTFRKAGKSLEQLTGALEAKYVYFSVSTVSWALLDFQKRGIDWAIRISPHYFNTESEVDRLCEIINGI